MLALYEGAATPAIKQQAAEKLKTFKVGSPDYAAQEEQVAQVGPVAVKEVKADVAVEFEHRGEVGGVGLVHAVADARHVPGVAAGSRGNERQTVHARGGRGGG
mgnify:CR=1 FL=1